MTSGFSASSLFRARFFSLVYRLIRRVVIGFYAWLCKFRRRAFDLELAVHRGDRFLEEMPIALRKIAFDFPIPKGLERELCGLKFMSPVTFASFKDHQTTLETWLQMGAGGGCLKTIMQAPREGNPRPRLQEVHLGGEGGLINAMGLPGKGVQGLILELERGHFFQGIGRPLGLSIGGNSISEYISVFETLEAWLSNKNPFPYYFELNISCPNTPEGQAITQHPNLLTELLTKIREKTNVPVGVKISPDQSDEKIQETFTTIRPFPKIFVNAGNTQFRKATAVGLPPGALQMGGGGLSGPALLPRTLELVRQAVCAGFPVVATGGISTPKDAATALSAGATLVGLATALAIDPYIIPKINCYLDGRI